MRDHTDTHTYAPPHAHRQSHTLQTNHEKEPLDSSSWILHKPSNFGWKDQKTLLGEHKYTICLSSQFQLASQIFYSQSWDVSTQPNPNRTRLKQKTYPSESVTLHDSTSHVYPSRTRPIYIGVPWNPELHVNENIHSNRNRIPKSCHLRWRLKESSRFYAHV